PIVPMVPGLPRVAGAQDEGRPMRVDQYLPGFAPHDAIGGHVLQARRVLREAGYQSDIWAEHIIGPMEAEARPYLEDTHKPDPDRLLVYHTSTSSPMAAWLAERAQAETVLGHYHNITPGRFFARWEPHIAEAMHHARRELAMLAPSTTMSFADSAYNESELIELGYRSTAVCPILVDLEDYHLPPEPRTLDRLQQRREHSGAHWLFVGRIAPNKCQHEIVGAFAVYRKIFDPGAHLTLVGGATSPNYRHAVHRLVHDLELGDSVELLEGLRENELLAYWAVADVFVCLSEHEGFCVPVLEAMELGVPVVAYAATAVPETLGGAGVLLDDKDPLAVALAVDEACRPGPVRDRLIEAGKKRASDLSLANTSKLLLSGIASLQ
ncbi:MAG TPA: glycosyltransferase, partial [Acidimicrobiales bacterium]|nr:glycosyltransferase [Acidimicrobiales bacterium]